MNPSPRRAPHRAPPVVFVPRALHLGACLLLGACGAGGAIGSQPADPAAAPSADAAPRSAVGAGVRNPVGGLGDADRQLFATAEQGFDAPFLDRDGLGPVFAADSCAACHAAGGKGPGLVSKMAILGGDGLPLADDSGLLPFGHTEHPLVAGGATTPVLPPNNIGSPDRLLVSQRLGPAVFGRGLLEAVADSEILRVQNEQSGRSDGIHGQVNFVAAPTLPDSASPFTRGSPGDRQIGRFGLKARVAGLDEFAADALQNDMAITSPQRPTESTNPDGLTDDHKPGLDLNSGGAQLLAAYTRLLAVPPRPAQDDVAARLFATMKCAVCHAPSLHTDAAYPVAALRDVDVPVFTDLLLHDMGNGLADGIAEGNANGRQWRSAPLIGLRFQDNFLHDGRARSIEQAILQHAGTGSEANGSVSLFQQLDSESKARLLQYVGGL